MDLREQVKNFIKLERTDFNFEEGNSDENNLSYGNREHGDVGEEEYSEIDWEAGVKLAKELKGEFGNAITVNLETIDEWVQLDVTLN